MELTNKNIKKMQKEFNNELKHTSKKDLNRMFEEAQHDPDSAL